MKKIMQSVTCGMLALSLLLGGCAAGASQPAAEPEATEAEQTPTIVGGWTINGEVTKAVDADAAEAFDLALDELNANGVTYEAVASLASQLVSGTNYAYLCKGTDASGATEWYVVVVYKGIDGTAAPTHTQKLDVSDLKVTADGAASEMVGAWAIVDPSNAALLPAEAKTAFDQAAEKHLGLTLSPIATLATQVVSGTNYLVLCQGAPTTANPQNGLYVATVYENLDGVAEFTSVEALDLVHYVTPKA